MRCSALPANLGDRQCLCRVISQRSRVVFPAKCLPYFSDRHEVPYLKWKTQLELAYTLGFVNSEKFSALLKECAEIACMLNGLLKAFHGK